EVGRLTLPAGPLPLMPNKLWYFAASPLRPQADSSIACAIVTAAGTPNRCCAAIAPGATMLMNACWSLVPGVAYWPPDELACAADGDVATGLGADVCAGRPLGVAAGCVG